MHLNHREPHSIHRHVEQTLALSNTWSDQQRRCTFDTCTSSPRVRARPIDLIPHLQTTTTTSTKTEKTKERLFCAKCRRRKQNTQPKTEPDICHTPCKYPCRRHCCCRALSAANQLTLRGTHKQNRKQTYQRYIHPVNRVELIPWKRSSSGC